MENTLVIVVIMMIMKIMKKAMVITSDKCKICRTDKVTLSLNHFSKKLKKTFLLM